MKNTNDAKPILSIETSQNTCGACVYFDDDKFFECKINFKNAHAEKIFEVVDVVIRSSGITLCELFAVAVSAGPGSFTGLRIGMSAAKGIAFGQSLPIILVPTFEAFAYQIASTLADGTEFIISNKVNREEIYFAKFKVTANNYIFVRNLQILTAHDSPLKEPECLVFGNVDLNSSGQHQFKHLTSPYPEYVAKWAKKFGTDKLNYNYDFLEPNYLKNFLVKEK